MAARLLHRLQHALHANAVVLEEVWSAGDWPVHGDILWLRCKGCGRLSVIGP